MKNKMPGKNREKRWQELRRFDRQDMLCCTLTLARRYVTDFPEHDYSWVIYGDALCALARYKEALVAYRTAQRQCPPDKVAYIYNRFGNLCEQKGNFRLAEKWFRQSIQLRPFDASGYIYLGGLFALEGRLQEAETIHRKAIVCKEGCIDEAYYNLGLVLRAQDCYPEAVACFKKAIEMDPKYKDAKKELKDVERFLELEKSLPAANSIKPKGTKRRTPHKNA